MSELVGNILILQVGCPSVMTNVILAELVKKSLNYECIEEIYGCVGGLSGLLGEQFVDLAAQAQKNISNLVGTPGAALKAVNVDDFDAAKALEVFNRRNIKYLFVIGDRSAIGTCKNINSAIKSSGYDMRIMLIPTSQDNDIQLTDHCLGYGSMAKHLAVMAKSVVCNVQSTQKSGAITILEIKDCDNEWLLASLALARFRKDSNEAPHMVIFSNFDEGMFVKNVNSHLRNLGNCVVVVGSKLINAKGENLLGQKSAGEYIEFIAKANFDVEIQVIPFNDWRLTSCMTLSAADVLESELCAQKALELCITVGISGKMVTLLRADGVKYTSEINCVDFENIPDKGKAFSEAWYLPEEMMVDVSFFKYASPLIVGESACQYDNGLPMYSKLKD